MLKFKANDSVKIMAGKDKGREGKIERVYPRNRTVLIPGLNIYKKHVKPAVSADKKGGIYDIPRPISFAAIALLCPNCKKVTRVGFRVTNAEKTRICKKCKVAIDRKTK